jgi:outer membrane protein TolC
VKRLKRGGIQASSGGRQRPLPRPAFGSAFWGLIVLASAGCRHPGAGIAVDWPTLSPTTQPAAAALELDAAQIQPMYRELMAIDLATIAKVTLADNLEIRRSRREVEGLRGQLESAVGSALPVVVPTALFEHVEGSVRAVEGNIVGVRFNTFQPSIAIQWVVNPGRVIYEIVAAKKRLNATQHQERAVVLETLRLTGIQFYELVLAQAQVAAAQQSVVEAQELLRINRLRARTGTGVPADELRAEARVAERQQDLLSALKAFYDASISLTVTLHLDDSTVTLVPKVDRIPPIQLVSDEFTIDQLLQFAVVYRPDLEAVRMLAEAAEADRGATWWGAFGPQFQAAYQYGGITGRANNIVGGEGLPGNLIVNPLSANGSFVANPVANGLIKESLLRGSKRLDSRDDQTFSFSDQQRATAGAGWRLSLSAFGDLKTAKAAEEQIRIDAERQLDRVKAQVVRAEQASKTNRQLIDLADQQITSAEEALRLTQANLEAGTMTTLDVLQSQDAVAQARLRHAEAVVRYNQGQVNLLAAVGLLTEGALGVDVDEQVSVGSDEAVSSSQ